MPEKLRKKKWLEKNETSLLALKIVCDLIPQILLVYLLVLSKTILAKIIWKYIS